MRRRQRLAFALAVFLALVSVILLNVTFARQSDYKIAIVVGNIAGLVSIGILGLYCRRGKWAWWPLAVIVAIPVLFLVADTGRRIPYAFGLFPHGYRFVIPDSYIGYFRVAFGQPKAQPLPMEDSFRLVRVSPKGEAETSDSLLRQREKVDEFVFEGTGKEAPIADKWVLDEQTSGTTFLYVFVGKLEDFFQWRLSQHDRRAYGPIDRAELPSKSGISQ